MVYAVILLVIFYYIDKYKRKKDEKVMNDWYDAQDNMDQYIRGFYAKLENNLEGNISTSLEDIDVISHDETTAYKILLKEKHKTRIAYVERNHQALDKDELILLLKEIADDEALSDRAMRLIFLT
jgi:hypothetical protein